MTASAGDHVDERLLVLVVGVEQVVGQGVASAIADAADSSSPAFLPAGAIAPLGSLSSLALRRPHVSTAVLLS